MSPSATAAARWPSILPRLQQGWTIAPDLRSAFGAPAETARRMYYDNIVFDPGLLRHLIAVFGDTRVLAGSDYPYLAGQDFPGRPFLSTGTLAYLKPSCARCATEKSNVRA